MLPGMQLKLFECDDPPRPKYLSDEVLEMTLDKLMPHVISWLQEGNRSMMCDDDNYQYTRDDVKRAIEFDDDAYEIVRSLDNMGWGIHRSLIDIMDKVENFRHSSHKYFVEKWVLNNGVQPKFELNQKVSFKQRGAYFVGSIVKIDEAQAKYLIFCKELGHVSEGKIGTHGTYVPYEEVKIIEEEGKK